jgi:hypothetical protein
MLHKQKLKLNYLTNDCLDLQKANIFIKLRVLLCNTKHAGAQTLPALFILCTACKGSIKTESVGANIITLV